MFCFLLTILYTCQAAFSTVFSFREEYFREGLGRNFREKAFMAFHSLQFLIFFAATALLYYRMLRRFRLGVLLVMSCVFYLCADPRAVFFLFGSAAITYAGARLLEREKLSLAAGAEEGARRETERRKKRLLALILFANLGLLAAVKYTAFAAETLRAVLPLSFESPHMLLPLGISFYVLQSTGYVIDVYREEYGADRSFLRYALFVSFFPQLIQGPIGRHDALARQFDSAGDLRYENLSRGLQQMLWGCFKKLVIADALAAPVAAVFDGYLSYGGAFMFLACAAYGLQLYCDFSGGVDVARGAARFFGIELAENFRQPYFSTSVAVFWRRWHITLGSVMRDYLFYPLSLSRPVAALGKRSRKRWPGRFGRALPAGLVSVIVFLVVGLWHGGAWKYAAYGLWHACFIAGGMLLGPWLGERRAALGIRENHPAMPFVKAFLTFCAVTLGYLFFRADTLRVALSMFRHGLLHPGLRQIFDGSLAALAPWGAETAAAGFGLLLVLAVGILRERGRDPYELLLQKPWAAQGALTVALLAVTLYFGAYSDYIASEYIYMNF
jgi:D-alanyl-lipoteichoic acid acyltransferase DltB (MBOAT superfamily)